MNKEHTKELTLKSDLQLLNGLDDFLKELDRDNLIDEEKMAAVMLVLSEAATNAMLHGNKLDPEREIHIGGSVNPEFLELIIEDQGEGFSPDDVPDPLAEENLLKTSGRGVYLMKEYADEVEYNDKGNRLRLRFNL